MGWERSDQSNHFDGQIWVYKVQSHGDWMQAEGGLKFSNAVAKDRAREHVDEQLAAGRSIDVEVNVSTDKFRLHNAQFTGPWEPVTPRFLA